MNLDKALLVAASVFVALGVVGAVVGTLVAPDEVSAPPPAVVDAPEPPTPDVEADTDPAGEPSTDEPQTDEPQTDEPSALPTGAPLDLPATVALVDPEALRSFLERLASDATQGRKTGTEGAQKARELLVAELREAGLDKAGEHFEVPFEREGLSGVNVAAFIKGSDPELANEIILVGAHYDHLGVLDNPRKPDLIFNGADNNGSGTTVALFTARALARSRVQLKRSVLFVFFDAGEQKLAGSWSYVEAPLRPLEQTMVMLNIDTVGRNTKKSLKLYGINSKELRNLTKALLTEHRDYEVSPLSGTGRLRKSSDGYPFLKMKRPVLVLHGGHTADENKVSDSADKVDIERLSMATRFTILLVHALANAESL